MITSRLTTIMVAMSLLGAGGPIAAMAQATADNDALQAEGEESSSEAESEAEATSAVANSTIFANNAQSATTNQLNLLEDNDDVTVNATQAALRTAIAADVNIENATATEIGDLLELFGLDVDGPVVP
jgi:hypothetical protein